MGGREFGVQCGSREEGRDGEAIYDGGADRGCQEAARDRDGGRGDLPEDGGVGGVVLQCGMMKSLLDRTNKTTLVLHENE